MIMIAALLFGLLSTGLKLVSAQLLPDVESNIMNELEHLYFDDTGPQGFKSGLTPCTTYVDSTTGLHDNTLGRQTSAQWIRTSFHDFVTADVASGVGGLDASIGFELSRPENVGVAFNDSLFFFSFFFSDKASMADLIAMGTAMSVGVCGGPPVPYRGGRVDATGPGASGVPKPDTNITTTLAEFSRAGFNKQDAITLTACGHTMGGVHHSTFPDVVNASAIGPCNSGGRIAWDDTVAKFDVDVVRQYLAGTFNGGGPLVTTQNKTMRSDLRLYASDHNVTVQKLGRSADEFRTRCSALMARMIDTVPQRVTLTPQLDPSHMKHANVSLNIGPSGQLTLSGFFRYIETADAAPAPSSLTVSVVARNGRPTQHRVKATTDLTKDTGNGVYGPTFQYPFSVTFPATTGLSGVRVDSRTFPLTDSLFVTPLLSSISPGLASYNIADPTHEFTFNITAALLTAGSYAPNSLKGTIALPVPQPGNMSPKIDTSTIVQLDRIGTAGPFTLYSVVLSLNITSLQLFGSSIDIEDGRGAVAMFFKLFSILQFF